MPSTEQHKSIVLLSGGLDSATVLYHTLAKGNRVFCLAFDYGQRHDRELQSARALAELNQCSFEVVQFNLPWKGSSLIDQTMEVPHHPVIDADHIPSTYVPARNIVFLSFAVSYAEVVGAQSVSIGANALDYSGYPDCRPEFFQAFSSVINTGMKCGVQGDGIEIDVPLLQMTKAEIIMLGSSLNVPYEHTWSCYQGELNPCGECDSCVLRAKGFLDAGLSDPLLKKSEELQ